MWFLKTTNDILGCADESDDTEQDNFVIGLFSILVGGGFYFYLFMLGIAGIILPCEDLKIKIVGGIIVGAGTALGFIDNAIDAVLTGTHENCGTPEANSLLFFNVLIIILSIYVIIQIGIVLLVVFLRKKE